MNHGEKKIAKIIEELTIYFFSIGADKIESGISREGSQVTIYFKSNFQEEYRKKLDNLDKYFHEPKNEGIEDFYWELAGSGDPGESSQILLVGMMIDKAEVSITDTEVTIKMYKNLP